LQAKIGSPLICTHIVEGHRSPVLSIKVCETSLFTGAAEGNLKVWDLRRNDNPTCLPHQAPVVAVEFDPKHRTLFSASGSLIKVWDLRDSNIKPVKTLNCESPITALTLGGSGNLYSAQGDKVKFWDLRTFSCLGKLSGGFQSGIVMCLTAWDGPANTDFIATGSKDHYVKVFEVPTKSNNNVLPLLNLEPPHYDGVQALAVANDAFGVDAELFSGSRDSGIKRFVYLFFFTLFSYYYRIINFRWDLKNGELKQSLNNCHKSWVSGMCCNGDVLLSSCRGGIIRLWNVRSCEALAEMKTDSSINDITCSDNRIFTASGYVLIVNFSLKRRYFKKWKR
jgi:WD40 repeat protein